MKTPRRPYNPEPSGGDKEKISDFSNLDFSTIYIGTNSTLILPMNSDSILDLYLNYFKTRPISRKDMHDIHTFYVKYISNEVGI